MVKAAGQTFLLANPQQHHVFAYRQQQRHSSEATANTQKKKKQSQIESLDPKWMKSLMRIFSMQWGIKR